MHVTDSLLTPTREADGELGAQHSLAPPVDKGKVSFPCATCVWIWLVSINSQLHFNASHALHASILVYQEEKVSLCLIKSDGGLSRLLHPRCVVHADGETHQSEFPASVWDEEEES